MSLQVFRDRLREKIASVNQSRGPGSIDVQGLLEAEKLLDEYIVEQCQPDDDYFRDAISLANLRIGANEVDHEELQVDGDAEFSETDDGLWVQSWIFLSNEDIKAFRKTKGTKRRVDK